MGLLVGGAFLACVAVSRLLGMLLLAGHGLLARRGRGSWNALSMALLSLAGACVLVALDAWIAASAHPGAPTADDYGRWILIAGAVGVSCGLAVTGLEAHTHVRRERG